MAHLGNTIVNGALRVLGQTNTDTLQASGQIKTSFKNSIANGSFAASSTTVPDLCTELRYSSGATGSVSIGTAYTKDSVTIPTGWYNFMWIPHRSGGVNGSASGDNCDYGTLYLTAMNMTSSFFLVRFTSGSIAEVKNVLKDDNTDTKVTQTATTTDAKYEILFSATADNTTRTEGARKTTTLRFNPSKGALMEGYDTVATGNYSHAEGNRTTASGNYSHAEGIKSYAKSEDAHAEGQATSAVYLYAHAEGSHTCAASDSAHAEGSATTAGGQYSHTEGRLTYTTVPAISAHAEGHRTTASGKGAHAEGGYTTAEIGGTKASGENAHAEGFLTTASANYSHAEGQSTNAAKSCAHAEGYGTTASGQSSHAEGNSTVATGTNSHAEGNGTTASGNQSHAEGYRTTASGNHSHAEGQYTCASGNKAHAEGNATRAIDSDSHAEGNGSIASGQSSHAEGSYTCATGLDSHAEGDSTIASGDGAHAEGDSTTASGLDSHAEGYGTTASGNYSHAEGYNTLVVKELYDSMYGSHAEGYQTTCGRDGSGKHAEGFKTSAYGTGSHSEGVSTIANNSEGSHAEGYYTTASGYYSHASGQYTCAAGQAQTVIGKYNVADTTSLFIIGNGTSSARSNALRIDSSGNFYTNKLMKVYKESSVSTSTTGTWTAMCRSDQAGSPTLPTTSEWWNVISLNNWTDTSNNWVSQLAIATQDSQGKGVWWRTNDTGGTNISSSTWHRLAEGENNGLPKFYINKIAAGTTAWDEIISFSKLKSSYPYLTFYAGSDLNFLMINPCEKTITISLYLNNNDSRLTDSEKGFTKDRLTIFELQNTGIFKYFLFNKPYLLYAMFTGNQSVTNSSYTTAMEVPYFYSNFNGYGVTADFQNGVYGNSAIINNRVNVINCYAKFQFI